jgi:hypothetical protein
VSAGYGRGYYGADQLAKPPRRGNGWIKLAVVAGVGAVVWLMWPRAAQGEPSRDGDVPQLPPPQPQSVVPPAPTIAASPAQPPPLALAPPAPLALPDQQHAAQFAQSRGYPTSKDYEDAVVASARQLQDSGAKVVMAPHLAHLTSRLTP